MNDVVVKDSSIHGKGLFAARPFRKGEVVLKWQNLKWLSPDELARLSKSECSYLAYSAGKPLMMGEPERYVNHACDCNTYAGDECDIAKRDITLGEEITTDYALSYIPEVNMKCSCGSKKCQKMIREKKEPRV